MKHILSFHQNSTDTLTHKKNDKYIHMRSLSLDGRGTAPLIQLSNFSLLTFYLSLSHTLNLSLSLSLSLYVVSLSLHFVSLFLSVSLSLCLPVCLFSSLCPTLFP